MRGRPARGRARSSCVELSDNGEPRRSRTRPPTPTAAPTRRLIGGRPVPIGRYELRFSRRATISRGSASPLADPPFLDVVPVRFSVAEPEGHYHVPLLVTPWSYSTYRGS